MIKKGGGKEQLVDTIIHTKFKLCFKSKFNVTDKWQQNYLNFYVSQTLLYIIPMIHIKKRSIISFSKQIEKRFVFFFSP